MKNILYKRFILLLTILTSTLSCSKALLFEDTSHGLNGQTGTLIISGIVTDKENNTPLEGVEVSFQCDAPNFEKISSYTNNIGIFIIKAEGFVSKINGCITAKDAHDKFLPVRRDVTINWKGESYDPKTGMFAINDCNFQLNRK